jgi:hypothetical protein
MPRKREAGIGLIEVVVASHLHRAVAGVGHFQRHRRLAGIEGDIALCGNDFSGYHDAVPLIRQTFTPL